MAVTLNIRRKPEENERLRLSEHMTAAKFDEQVRGTFVGQAHFAGTGPKGKTCRECLHWHKVKRVRIQGTDRFIDEAAPPGYFSDKHPEKPGELKKARCNRPIMNKAKRQIPHFAMACRLFEPNDNPPPETRPEK
ncbi:hypothetical protein [Nitratireductor rhodophyticola]|uniref:hypothetical protein n=1 Tax=Nitratireductor rhodophyticola TaxID=2854036 RepID=UPI003BAB9C16